MALVSANVYSDTIILKSGKVIEGELTKETEDYIKIKTSGFVLTYFKDAIKEHKKDPVLEKENKKKKLKEIAADLVNDEAKNDEDQKTLFLNVYDNKHVSIKKPAIWDEVRQYIFPYQSYGEIDLAKISHKAAYDEGLLVVSQKERPKKPMAFNVIAKYVVQEIDKNKIKNRPKVKYLNGERVVNFAQLKKYNSKPVIADITIFFRGKRWYVVELVVKEEDFLAYRNMFKEILESIELH